MQIKNNLHETRITTYIGKALTSDLISFMINHRIKEYGINKKDFENQEKESVFFFLEQDDGIKAFGMLKPVVLHFDNEKFQIMGIGNIMAVEKGKGYGSLLMNHIKNYLETCEYVGVGSTHGNNFAFYKNCGFTFIPSLIEKIVYIDENLKEQRRSSDAGDHEMFIFDKNNKLQELIQKYNDIIIRVPFW